MPTSFFEMDGDAIAWKQQYVEHYPTRRFVTETLCWFESETMARNLLPGYDLIPWKGKQRAPAEIKNCPGREKYMKGLEPFVPTED